MCHFSLRARSELPPNLKAQAAGTPIHPTGPGERAGHGHLLRHLLPTLPCPRLDRSLSGLVHIWSLQTRRAIATLDGHGGQCVIWLQTLPQGPQLLR